MILRPVNRSMKGFFPGLSYVPGGSFLHRMHPLAKVVLLLCFSLAVFALPSPLPGGIILLGLLAAYQLTGLGMLFFWRKLRMILFFGFTMILVQVLSVKEGYLIGQIPLWVITLEVWSEGIMGGLSMMFRFLNVIGFSYLFVSTTDPNRLAYGLMQAGLPYRYGFMLITSLRFIPVFQLELNQVRNAQMAKGIELEGLSFKRVLLSIQYLLIPLVLSALGKVDYLAISMEGRAFGLYPERSYLLKQNFTSKDWLIVVVSMAGFWTFYAFFK
jgi:energy-coupling factor transport system permease protein